MNMLETKIFIIKEKDNIRSKLDTLLKFNWNPSYEISIIYAL